MTHDEFLTHLDSRGVYIGPRLDDFDLMLEGCTKEKAYCFFSFEQLDNEKIRPFVANTCISENTYFAYKKGGND